MKPPVYQPWVFRLAVLTACVALLPIVIGGLVTTMQAGMAFPDWPSSDGHNMIAYPWLQSAGDKFLEHGHRLAGMLIGLVSIALAVVIGLKETRFWLRWCGLAVLLCVIAQGILGGQRVLLNEYGLAFLHGGFANLVFALMASVALFTSRSWLNAKQLETPNKIQRIRMFAALSTTVLFIQYTLGGLLRHLGWWPHQHLGFAAVVFATITVTVWVAKRGRCDWLWRPAHLMSMLLVVQVTLGAGAWVTKFGFGDHLVVDGSPAQIIFRTAHFVVGVLMFMVSTILLLRAARLASIGGRTEVPVAPTLTQSMGLPGGAQ